MAEPVGPNQPSRAPGRGWRVASAVLGIAVIGLVVALALVLADDDSAEPSPSSAAPTLASTTSSATTAPVPATVTTTAPATSAPATAAPTTAASTTATTVTTSTVTASTTTGASTTVQPPVGDLDVALWPSAAGPIGYTEPVALVRDFAEFVGMRDPDIGPYLAGDSRSGEIEVRAEPGAALATTVFVRQLGPNDLWWVLGAASANITIDTPRALEIATSPLTLSGAALAFEGTIAVALWEDGAVDPLATTFVTGSGSPPPGAFTGELTFGRPASRGGALVFTSASGEDGAVIEFAALRVFFG